MARHYLHVPVPPGAPTSEACRQGWASQPHRTMRAAGNSGARLKRPSDTQLRQTRWRGDARSIASAGRLHPAQRSAPFSDLTSWTCDDRQRQWTLAIRASSGCCRMRPVGGALATRHSCSSRTAKRWRCCEPLSATARRWPPASFTRSSHQHAVIRRSRGSVNRKAPACSSPLNAEAKAATSSSAGASSSSTCRGSRRSSSNASVVSTASVARSRWMLCTSDHPVGSGRTSYGCSKPSVSSASRWPGSNRNSPTWRTRLKRSP